MCPWNFICWIVSWLFYRVIAIKLGIKTFFCMYVTDFFYFFFRLSQSKFKYCSNKNSLPRWLPWATVLTTRGMFSPRRIGLITCLNVDSNTRLSRSASLWSFASPVNNNNNTTFPIIYDENREKTFLCVRFKGSANTDIKDVPLCLRKISCRLQNCLNKSQ